MLPTNSSRNIDRYEVEPYVFAEYVTSPDHPTENQASHSWLTGTAVWMYRIGLDYILGFRTDLNSITIAPNIPSAWKSAKYSRRFRRKNFSVSIINTEGGNSKIKSISVNGKKADNNTLPLDELTGNKFDIQIELEK
jgi:cellobiose phosphorylase